MRRNSLMCVAAAALLVLVACGENTKVGSEQLLDFEEEVQKGLGGKAVTPAPAATVAPQASVPASRRAAIGAQKDTPRQNVATIDIQIQGDRVGSAFKPVVAVVFVGSIAKWTNTDTKARSVEADGDEFTSGPIAPGAAWSYTTTKPGKFNYHDGTRPYAVATLEVRPK